MLKLWERFNVPEYKGASNLEIEVWTKEIKTPIQARTCFILKSLINMEYEHFSMNLSKIVKIMIFLMEEKYQKLLIPQILKKKKQMKEKKKEKKSAPRSRRASVISSVNTMLFSNANKIFRFKASEIAKELTLIDFATFRKIKPSELLNQSWAKHKKDIAAPNVRQMIDQFNYISKAVTTSILNEEKIKLRSRIFTKWIKVAVNLEQLQNYHTLMAVLMGFEDTSVYRLKETKQQIKIKYTNILKDLNKLMSPEDSHGMYRKRIANTKPPCIPYIGVYLKDLTYIESTPSERVKNGVQGFRFNRNLQVYGIINTIKTFQESTYNFPSNKELNSLLEELAQLSDEECYKLSLKLEPKK